MLSSFSPALLRRIITAKLFIVAAALSCFFLYRAAGSIGFPLPTSFIPSPYLLPSSVVVSTSAPPGEGSTSQADGEAVKSVQPVQDGQPVQKVQTVEEVQPILAAQPVQEIAANRLERVLKDASMQDQTVILTTLNEAWAVQNSVFDLFLESFRIGDHTSRLLKHLVVIALDQKAYSRCLDVHTHCFALVSEDSDLSREAYFMTPDYLNMMWKRINFLQSVLEMGYNFVFTDADVMWFRNPFTHFRSDADFQIACDHFSGNSTDLNNQPNGGFNFVRSNNRSIAFYKFWYASRQTHPGLHDQDVLNRIKYHPYLNEIGLQLRFLSTGFFGGFCEPSKNLNEVCTMHANCCFGLDNKVHDLRIMIEDWKMFMSLPRKIKISQGLNWRVFQNCRNAFQRHFAQPSNGAKICKMQDFPDTKWSYFWCWRMKITVLWGFVLMTHVKKLGSIRNDDDSKPREMVEARVPLAYRDQCAHLLIPLNKCRQAEFYLPWKCENERHTYEKCEYELVMERMLQMQKIRQQEAAKLKQSQGAPLPLIPNTANT